MNKPTGGACRHWRFGTRLETLRPQLVLALNDGVNRGYFPDPGPPGRLTILTRF
jgi:hypothetical protein